MDDVAGVIVDVEVATGEENEGIAVVARLDAITATTGAAMAVATMDAGYAYAKVFRALEDREIEGVSVPAKSASASSCQSACSIAEASSDEFREMAKTVFATCFAIELSKNRAIAGA